MSNPFTDLGHQIEHVAHDIGNKVVDAAEQAVAQGIVDAAVDYLATDGVSVAEEAAVVAIELV